MQASRRRNFAENPDSLLWLGLLERNTKKPATEWLEVADKTEALDLELAISYRLMVFDRQRDETQAKRIANEIGVMLFGEKQ